jgi:superfamily II RNA helicase
MTRSSRIKEEKNRFLSGVGVPEKAEFVIDDFQKEAIYHLTEGYDTLVVAPTGAGKTYIAVEAIKAVLMQGLKAVYTTPLKALSNTKFSELKRIFEPHYKVGLLTGDRKIEGDADVVVATTEIYRNELYRGEGRYSLTILDEVHFIADAQRGAVWEESIILSSSTSTLLMLSASISNFREISEWIEEVRGKTCKVVVKKERPVELRLGFLHPELGVIPLRDEQDRILKDVKSFYGSFGLDKSGLRVKRVGAGPSRARRRGGRRR